VIVVVVVVAVLGPGEVKPRDNGKKSSQINGTKYYLDQRSGGGDLCGVR
jgi:hypothetical protein